uniref:Uncharacterized protein n=1 Tax=Echeneis naucrates TaxID=173247 RepID=A0A665TYX2_ECHNA
MQGRERERGRGEIFCTSLLFLLAHICFQTVLYTYPPLSITIGDNCSQWNTITKHIGVSRLPLDDPWSVVRLMCPDLGVCVVALVTIVLCSRLVRNRQMVAAANITSVSHYVLSDFSIFLSGITLPSAFSAIYFLLFISVCTWWAYHLPISHLGFNALCVMVGFFTAGHMICLYLYQSLQAQAMFPPHSLWARLFGLKDIIIPGNCSSPYDFTLNVNHDWPVYVNPGILFLLYITIITVLKTGCHGPPYEVSGAFSFIIKCVVWSITYHSWLTFVLLLWACLIWILRSRRHAATLCSPFILLYGLALCCLQYVWAMELQPELPNTVGTMSLRQLGLDRAQYPCLRLGNESVLKVLGGMVMSCYAKYWIYVCGGMFIMVSFAGKLVGYKIIYMLLFLLCLCLYQVYYSLWRRLLKLFWWLVVAYTMLVLISVYTYQFEDFPQYWRNFTGFTEEQLAAIGLETFALSELFTSILIPGFFLLACILQLHYFHKPFMRITNLEHVTPIHNFCCFVAFSNIIITTQPAFRKVSERTDGTGSANVRGSFEEQDLVANIDEESEDEVELVPSKWGLVMDRLLVLSRRFSDILTKVQVFLWAVLELHILKMVALFSVDVLSAYPSVMNLVLVILWSLAMPYSRFRPMASCLSTVWVCVIIVCKMLYQLTVVNPTDYSSNCTLPLTNETNLLLEEMRNSSLYKAPVDPANWFGIRKDATVLGYSKNHLIVLMLLVFEATVYRHQAHHYRQLQQSPPTIPALFPAATRDTLDKGLIACFKYLLNYTFYKFGLEICFLMTVNVIGQRMNFLVIIHGSWLVAILVKRRRAAIAQIWPRYCLFLSIFMIYQYLLCVGIPPALCIDYPWRWNTPVLMNSALIKWLYLPDFFTVPNSRNLIADFVLLMCASQQWKVFECEHTEEWMVMAGENTDDPEPMKGRLFNPAPNFINCRSYLDMAKVLVFRHLFWFMLSVVFITGATRISVFGLGYLMACFFFLLFGTKLLVKPSRTRLALWDCLIIYNVAVIISKNMLSILACVFVHEMQKSFCWVIQLFSLVCTVKGYYDPKAVSDKTCSLPVEEAGIIWDSICFLCLLLQRRIFLSFYFLHVTTELQASAKQASRGFELFRASIVKNIKFYQQAEQKSLSQLKRSSPKIRYYSYSHGSMKMKFHGQMMYTISNLFLFPTESQTDKKKSKKKQWSQPWLDHATVLHSGEYYLFESDSEDEEDMQFEEQKPQKRTAFQFAYEAWVTNVKKVLRERQRHQRQLRGLERREKERDGRVDSQQGASSEIGHGEMVQRILDILHFLWAIVLAMVDGLTQWLNLLTKQYRETSTVLCNERYFIIHQIQQVKTISSLITIFLRCFALGKLLLVWTNMLHAKSFGLPERLALDVMNLESLGIVFSHKSPSLSHSMCLNHFISCLEVDSRGHCTPRINSSGNLLSPAPSSSSMQLLPEPLKHRHSRTASELLGDRQFFIEELEQSREFFMNQNRLLKLLFAMYNLLAANSELVCYFIIVLNNVVSASVISLVLPILVFLWAMLAVPRPTKRFWMTAIVYTEVMVVMKYLFQFGFFPWNSSYEMTLNEDKPFFPPRILGLEKTDSYIRYDLLQLLALFFHRSLLMVNESRRLSSTATLNNLEMTGVDKLEKVGANYSLVAISYFSAEPHRMYFPLFLNSILSIQDSLDYAQPSASCATPQFPTAEPALTGSQDGCDTLSLEERMEEQLIEEVPQKRSSIRFRRNPKQPREQRSKGLCCVMVKKLPMIIFICVLHPSLGIMQFFSLDILHAEYQAATDVYALMFLTDVIDFIIVIFGFWAFGKHSAAADIASTLSEDQVPEAFLVMLLIQFSTMIIDRALYLRKAVLGKLIFQVILVFGIHLWMFFILPAVTERMFNQNFVAQLWYFVKCIYFGLSAYQIRCGYPTRILGNFLTKKYNHLNLFLFQGFRLVPFLVELRAVMDWVWTDTTLSLSNWMCVEDIYANIFIIKCSRETEKNYPQPKGQKKKKIVKYGMGGLIIFFLICIIWFPLLFISLVRSVVGVVNHPIDVTVTVKLGGYEPLFTMSVQQQSIQPFTVAMQFITLYSYEDIVTAMIEGSSGSIWRISPPSRQEVIKELLGSPVDLTLSLHLKYCILSLLRHVPNMFPNYIRAPNGAEAKPVSQSLNDSRNQEWWDIAIAGCSPSPCRVLPMIIFNDKVSPPSLGFLAGYGIMGLYVSVVLVIGKFVRGFFSEISHSIMFEELPCVDRILKLCTDIFLVRETGELELEEELYSKLIFLYRSPETMIKWTRDIHSREVDRH